MPRHITVIRNTGRENSIGCEGGKKKVYKGNQTGYPRISQQKIFRLGENLKTERKLYSAKLT